MALDSTTTSGTMPACSKANILPVRAKPLWISSTISATPACSVIRRKPRSQSRSAGTTPPSPWTTSTITAAGNCTPPSGSFSRFSR